MLGADDMSSSTKTRLATTPAQTLRQGPVDILARPRLEIDTHTHTRTRIGRQAGRQADRQDRQDRRTGQTTQTDRQTDKTNRQTDRQAGRQTESRTRQTGQTRRLTNRTNRCCLFLCLSDTAGMLKPSKHRRRGRRLLHQTARTRTAGVLGEAPLKLLSGLATGDDRTRILRRSRAGPARRLRDIRAGRCLRDILEDVIGHVSMRVSLRLMQAVPGTSS